MSNTQDLSLLGSTLTSDGDGVNVTGSVTADGLDVNSITSGAANIQVGNAAADIALGIGSPSTANKVVVTAGGSVGIGTGSPSYPLEVAGAAGDSLTITARSGDATAANNAGGGFRNIGSATATSRSAQIWLDADGANLGGGDYFYIEKKGNSGDLILSQYSNADIIFKVNAGAERLRIGSDGQLTSSVAGGVFNTRADGGGLEYTQLLDVATAGCTILGKTNRGDVASISLYQTATGADGGYIKFNTSNSGSTTPTEKVRIDASGNLLVGTTSGSGVSAPDNSATVGDAGVRVSGDGYIGVGIDSNPAMYLNRMGTNGDVLRFKHDGGLVGSIGTEGGDSLYIQSDGTGGAGLRFHPSTADIDPVRNRTRIDQYISLGSESARFKDLRLSGGVILDENPTIVGTTVVNRTITSKTLDDYEEGTWLPSINGLVPTTASGEYTKVGDMVHLHCYYDVASGTAIDESGALTIKGLPFIPTNDGAVGALMADDVNMSATGKYLVVYSVPTNGGGIRIYECGDNIPWLPLQSAAVGAGTTLHFSISYKTA